MPTEKPRVMLTLDVGTYGMLKQISEQTDLSVSGIVGRVLGAHMHELAEYLEWIEKLEDPRTRMLAKNLLQSYGPDDLMQGIRRIDPTHKFVSERFEEEIRGKKKKTVRARS